MPEPLYSPFVAGAIIQPRQLNRWLDINPINRLTRIHTYFVVPAFTIQFECRTYSDLVGAFNYEAPNNFIIESENLPIISPVDYVMCVMWKDSHYVTHRYAFWQDVGEVFYFDVPLYTGQLIKKNFRIEIWTISCAAPPLFGEIILDEQSLPIIGEGGEYIIGDY